MDKTDKQGKGHNRYEFVPVTDVAEFAKTHSAET